MKRMIPLLISAILAIATTTASALTFNATATVDTGHALNALQVGDVVTINVRMANPAAVAIFGVGAGVQGWDNAVMTFQTAELGIGKFFCTGTNPATCPAGLDNGLTFATDENTGNYLAAPGDVQNVAGVGNYLPIVQAISTTGRNGIGTKDPGLDGVVGGGDAQFRFVFRASAVGTTTIDIGTNNNPTLGNVVVLVGGATEQAVNATITLAVMGLGSGGTFPALLNANGTIDVGSDLFPQVEADGGGNWVAIWQSTDPIGGTGADADILLVRSGDDGETWTAPAALNSNATSDNANDDWPTLATDGTGHWIAAWRSNETLGGTLGFDWDVLFARSTNGGATWSAAAPLNTNAATDSGSDEQPFLASGGNVFVAVWESNDGALGPDFDIRVARSLDGGATWSDPVALNSGASSDTANDVHPVLAADRNGNWVAVWQTNRSNLGGEGDLLTARSSDGGATWSTPRTLNTNAVYDRGLDAWPDLATDDFGSWVVAWESNENLGGSIGIDRDILFARSTDAGATWSPPAALNSNAAIDLGDDANPDVATDEAGNWTTVWDSADTLGTTIGTDSDVLFARSISGGATWFSPLALGTNARTDQGGDYNPRIASRPAGRSIVVWHSDENLGGIAGTDWDVFFAPDSPPDRDSDFDGIFDSSDNCPVAPNPEQDDADADLIGDVCDPFPTDSCNVVGSLPRSTTVLAAFQDNTCENWSTVSQPAANLESAVLRKADLSLANLNGAVLLNTNLVDANLSGAQMVNTQLRNTNLTRADLSGANLSFSTLLGANLAGANLTGANLALASLAAASYDESTKFPSGNRYDAPPWGLPNGIEPWDAGMIPSPEPAMGIQMLVGLLTLAGLSRGRLRRDRG